MIITAITWCNKLCPLTDGHSIFAFNLATVVSVIIQGVGFELKCALDNRALVTVSVCQLLCYLALVSIAMAIAAALHAEPVAPLPHDMLGWIRGARRAFQLHFRITRAIGKFQLVIQDYSVWRGKRGDWKKNQNTLSFEAAMCENITRYLFWKERERETERQRERERERKRKRERGEKERERERERGFSMQYAMNIIKHQINLHLTCGATFSERYLFLLKLSWHSHTFLSWSLRPIVYSVSQYLPAIHIEEN